MKNVWIKVYSYVWNSCVKKWEMNKQKQWQKPTSTKVTIINLNNIWKKNVAI